MRKVKHSPWLTVSLIIHLIYITGAAANFKVKKKKNPDYSLASWNVLIELASDLLPETSDGAAEVLRYLSCRSLNESFSFIPDLTLTGTGIHLFKVISTGPLHGRHVRVLDGRMLVCVEGEIRAENLVSHCKMHHTVRVEVRRAQPSELSFFLPYHVTLRRQIYVDAIDRWVAYQAGRESWDF